MIDKHKVIALTVPKELSHRQYSGRHATVTRVHPLASHLSPATIGGKAYSLYRMASIGFRVPTACVLPIWVWHFWADATTVTQKRAIIAPSATEIWSYINSTWNVFNKIGPTATMIAVRSGAPASMPGMMDTVLGIQVNDNDRLVAAIGDVYKSMSSPRCIKYRNKRGIGDVGTAAICQALVVPEPESGGSGVAHSMDPVTGRGWGLYGEVLFGKVGDKLVGGKETPRPISDFKKKFSTLYDELYVGVTVLENAWNSPVEVEFAWNNNMLYYLQCRATRVNKPTREAQGERGTFLGRGFPASRGTATGEVVSPSCGRKKRENPIWVSPMTCPEDYPHMEKARGIVTLAGGTTCHAAVVARELGIPCVVAYQGEALSPGMEVYVDGFTGEVYSGK